MKRSIPWVLLALLLVLCACLVCALIGVAILRPERLPIDLSVFSRDQIVVRVPDRGDEMDYYLLRPGQRLDSGRLLADDALEASPTLWGQQSAQGFAWRPFGFGAFLPESRALLYSVQTPDETSLFFQARRGREPLPIHETDARVTTLLTLSDGETVFVIEEHEGGRVRCFLSRSGEEARSIARGDACEVSANGATLLVSEETDTALSLTAYNLDGTDEVTLLDQAEDTDLTFHLSADGTRVAYVQRDADRSRVVVLSRDDASVVLEGDDLFGILGYQFAPQGFSLFVIGETEEGDLALSLLGEDTTTLATGQALNAAFSPDGQTLIYLVTDDAGEDAVVAHPLSGGDDQVALEGGELSFTLLQSTGGLLILQDLEGEVILYRAEAGGEGLEELLSHDQPWAIEVYDLPGFSRFFGRATDAQGRTTFYVGPSAQEPGFELLEDWSGFTPLDVSPDGRQLAFWGQEEASDDPALFTVAIVQDATPVKLDDDPEDLFNALFTDDGDELFYTARTGPSPDDLEIRRVSSDGARPVQVLYPEAALEAASWDAADPFSSSSPSFLSGVAATGLCPGALLISTGREMEGELESGGRTCYRFRAEEPLEYSIGLITSDEQLDTRMEVYDRQGNQIAADDDSGPGLSPRLHLTLAEPGLYYIYVFGFGTDDQGPYTLTLSQGLPPTLEEAAVALTLDETVHGAITSESEVMVEAFGTSLFGGVYSFNAQAGDWMIADLAAGSIGSSLEPLLILIDPDFQAVSFGEPDAAGDAHLEASIPTSGRYYLLVMSSDESYGASDEYAFDLTLSQGVPPEPGGGPIAFGQTVNATLQATVHDEWTFAAAAGDYVTISMSSETVDTYLELYGPTGALLTQDDDSGGDLDSLIRNFVLPASGTYVIHASSYGRPSPGPYTLTLTRGSPDTQTGGPIDVGQTVDGDLGSGDRDRWTFTGRAGQVVTIRMTSEMIDPYLELLGPDGTQLIYNDDGAGYPNALIEAYSLPTAGTYTIVARSFGDSRSGTYVLALEEVLR